MPSLILRATIEANVPIACLSETPCWGGVSPASWASLRKPEGSEAFESVGGGLLRRAALGQSTCRT